jgi:glycosyltransferase involved in cell wall biosynthesis
MAAKARVADFVSAQRVDHFVANSNYIARRIRKYYCRSASVIYPPVSAQKGFIAPRQDDYYLSVGRLIKNKRIDLLIHACNQLKRRLVIVGEGRDERALKAIAGPTIEFAGWVSSDALSDLYARSRAFLFAADEDFGIVSIESQAYGRPVIAYGHGGSLETVRVDDPIGRSDTGVFFPEQSVPGVVEAILRFEAQEDRFRPGEIRDHALGFDSAIFKEKIQEFVSQALKAREMPGSVVSMRMRATGAKAAWDAARREA